MIPPTPKNAYVVYESPPSKALEEKLNSLIIKSDKLLFEMRMEVLACKEFKEKLVCLNSILVTTTASTAVSSAAAGEENRKLTC